MLYRLEDADSGVQLKVGTIHHLFIASESDHASTCLYVVGTKLDELLGKDVLKSHERLGDKFKFLFHY